MNIHDEFIKKANREIEKLNAEVEKKKARIAELRAQIKQHESEKARDSEFSDHLIKLMSENGVVSDDDRKAVLSKFEELVLSMEIEKGDKAQTEEAADSSENRKPETSPVTTSVENSNPASAVTQQNPAYPYRPASNGNFNS